MPNTSPRQGSDWMTRSFNKKIRCPNCGHEHTVETDFERWMRSNGELDSRRAGIVRFDLDILLHKYLHLVDGKGTRDIQCIMFIEVKTFMAVPSQSQVDTLSMLNQVLRNRRKNIHSNPRPQVEQQVTHAVSKIMNRKVRLKLYGGHLLQLDGSCPETSSLILWDNKTISKPDLIELMRFERDPDRPHLKIDHRRRSQGWNDRGKLF